MNVDRPSHRAECGTLGRIIHIDFSSHCRYVHSTPADFARAPGDIFLPDVPSHRRGFHISRHVLQEDLASHRFHVPVHIRVLQRDRSPHRQEVEVSLQSAQHEGSTHGLAGHPPLDVFDGHASTHRLQADVVAPGNVYLQVYPAVPVVPRLGVMGPEGHPRRRLLHFQYHFLSVPPLTVPFHGYRLFVPSGNRDPPSRLQVYLQLLSLRRDKFLFVVRLRYRGEHERAYHKDQKQKTFHCAAPLFLMSHLFHQ